MAGMAALCFTCLVGAEVLTRECDDQNCSLGKLTWMEEGIWLAAGRGVTLNLELRKL